MSKQVDVKCNDYGRLATIPLDEFSMTCTECGGLNLPIEAIPADELDALRQRAEATAAERDAARAQVAALREALRAVEIAVHSEVEHALEAGE